MAALTTTEQLRLWEWAGGVRVDGFEGKWGGDVREGMSGGGVGGGEEGGKAGGWGGGRVDYLVDCWYDREGGRLYVLGGNNNGSLGMWHVNRGEVRVVWEWVSENEKDYWEVQEKDVNVSIWVEEGGGEVGEEGEVGGEQG